MAITPFLSHQSFDPETLEVIGAAFDKVCAELGLCDRKDRLTEIVARRIIEVAQIGLRDETAIRLRVLRDLAPNRSDAN